MRTWIHTGTRGQGHCLTFVEGHSDLYFQTSAAKPPIEDKFHVELSWVVRMKVCSKSPGHVTKMATMPVYGKNPLKVSNQQADGRLILSYSQAAGHISQISCRAFMIKENKSLFKWWRLHGQDGCHAHMWLNVLKISSLEPEGHNDNLWMTFDFFTESSNKLQANKNIWIWKVD